jgi:hypothetical protein
MGRLYISICIRICAYICVCIYSLLFCVLLHMYLAFLRLFLGDFHREGVDPRYFLQWACGVVKKGGGSVGLYDTRVHVIIGHVTVTVTPGRRRVMSPGQKQKTLHSQCPSIFSGQRHYVEDFSEFLWPLARRRAHGKVSLCSKHTKSLCSRHTKSLCSRHTKSSCSRHTKSLCSRHTKSLCSRHKYLVCLLHKEKT